MDAPARTHDAVAGVPEKPEMSVLASGVGVSRAEDRPRLLWTGSTAFDLVLDSAHTQGSIALLDQTGERGDVTPLPIHHDEAEIFYVLEGDIVAWAGSLVMAYRTRDGRSPRSMTAIAIDTRFVSLAYSGLAAALGAAEFA